MKHTEVIDRICNLHTEEFCKGCGSTKRYGRIVKYKGKFCVQVETGLKDHKRLQAFLSGIMRSAAIAEENVEEMTDEQIEKYLELRSGQCEIISGNAPN